MAGKEFKSDHDMIYDIHTVLLGTNGQGGLCRDHENLKEDYYTFKRRVLVTGAFLGGGGGLGFGIAELIKLLG